MPGADVKQSAFDIKAEFKFTKTSLVLQEEILEVAFIMQNHKLVPRMKMNFRIDNRYRNLLLMPYTVHVIIVEKNMGETERTLIDSEWLSFGQAVIDIHREADLSSRPDVINVRHEYVAKDAYTGVNTVVGGLYENVKVIDVINSLWSKTNHGKLRLNVSNLDNSEKYEQIWIPNNKFFVNLAYISQRYGMFNIPPIIYTNLHDNVAYIKSLNDATTEKALELYGDLPQEDQDKIRIDDGQYFLPNLPSLTNSFNSIAALIPKKITLCKKSDTGLYKESEIDVMSLIRSMKFVDSVDSFENYLDKIVQPNTKIYLDQSNEYSLRESIASIILNTVKPISVRISQPFRFPHWYIGRKVVLKYKHINYKIGSEITFFISGIQFNIKRTKVKNAQGTINVMLNAVSTHDAYAG
jgi:hypothetical protein